MARIAENGAVVSEMPIDWEPRGRDFPRRNRIVSGLALGAIIVEAARGSGSLITARLAAEQKREVFAVPGSPLDPRAEGTNDLLRDGAPLCARVEDVLARSNPCARALRPGGWRNRAPATNCGSTGRRRPAKPPRPSADSGETAVGARVVALLGPAPVSIDELARVANADIRSVRAAVIELELAGRIERGGGDRVALLSAHDPD